MELKIGDIIQYKYDDWSYKVLDIDENRTDQILYECIKPNGESEGKSFWTHNVKSLLVEISNGGILIIYREIKPLKKINRLDFI